MAAAVRLVVVPEGRVRLAERLITAVFTSPRFSVPAVIVFSSVWDKARVFAMVSDVEPRLMFLPAVNGAMETVGALMSAEVTRLMLSVSRVTTPGEPVVIEAGVAEMELRKIPVDEPPPAVPVTVTLPEVLLIS